MFQWDKPQQVIGNLGLMAMRCNARVERMWAVTRESVTRYMARDTANSLLMGGDQHTVNKLLYQPTLAGAAPVRWGVLPPEVATRTSLKRRGMQMRTTDFVVYHSNEGGALRGRQVAPHQDGATS